MKTKPALLHLLKAKSSKYVSNEYLENIRLDAHEVLDGIVLELTTEVLDYLHAGNLRIERDYYNTITVPRFANPWEHLKARYSGRSWFQWYVKRWPVKHVNETYNVAIHADFTLDEHLTFPDSNLRFPPNLGQPIEVMMVTDERVRWSGAVDIHPNSIY